MKYIKLLGMLIQNRIKTIVLILSTIIFLSLAITSITIRSGAFESNLVLKIKIQGTNQSSNTKTTKIVIYNQIQNVQENPSIYLIKQTDNSYKADIPLNITDFSNQYALFIKPNRSIAKLICSENLTPCQSPGLFFKKGLNQLDITRSLFYVGDINQDGIINNNDTLHFLNYLSKKNPPVNEFADLNSDNVIDSQDYALLIYNIFQNQTDPKINFLITPTSVSQPSPTITPTPTLAITNPTPSSTPPILLTPSPTPITATVTPTQIGKCHALKPDFAGGGSYDLENNSSSICTCTMGVCAQAKCNKCSSGVCNCGNVPLQMPPIEMNCSGGATFNIQICTP